MKTTFRINQAIALAAITLVLGGSSAFGASRTWVGTTDVNWGTAGNWNLAAVPNGSNSALFNGAGNGNTIINFQDTNRSADRLLFLTEPAAYTFINAPQLTITIPSANGESIGIRSGVTTSQDLSGIALLRPSASSATFYVKNEGSGTLTLPTWVGQANTTQPLDFGGSGLIEVKGAGIQSRQNNNLVSVTKNDAGTLVIHGGATTDPTTSAGGRYNRTTTINGGVLRARHDFALGTTAYGTTVATGAALELQETTGSVNLSVGEPLTLNSDGISSGGALRNISGNNLLTGAITLASDTRINSNAGSLMLAVASGDAISGNFNLTLGGAGKIALMDPISVNSVQVDDGTTLSVGTTLNLPSLTLGSSTGATLEVTGWSGTSAVITATNFANNGAVTINITSASLTLGKHPLIAYTGVIGGAGFGGLSLGTLPAGVEGHLVNGPGSVDLNITNVTYVTWTGSVDGDWDVANKLNWTLLGSDTAYNQFDPVLFPDSAAETTVNLTTTLTPSSVTVANPTANYTFAGDGKISGGTGLAKSGAGTLTILSSNDYTGGTIISAGTLQIGDGSTVGAIAGNVMNEGAIVFNRSDAVTFAGPISGTGSLVKDSANILTLTGNNNHSGGTLVNAGTLQIGAGGTFGNLTGNVTNDGVVIFNRSDSLTYDGAISGSGTVTVTGAATTTFGGSNAYSGLTTITGILKLANTNGPCLAGPALIDGGSSGTKRIQLGAAEQIADTALLTMTGSGGATRFQMQGFNETIGGLANTASAGNMIVEAAADSAADKPATLTLNVPAGESYSFAPSGSSLAYLRDAAGVTSSPLTLIKTGLGAQILGGTNISYSGSTTISAGSLIVNGNLSSSALTLESGATLGGSGTIIAETTIPSGATLAPGDASAATLNFSNNVDLEPGSNYAVDITAAATSDQIATPTGTMTANGNIVVKLTGYTPVANDSFDIADAAVIAGNPTFDFTAAVLGVDLTWDTTQFATSGIIRVKSPGYESFVSVIPNAEDRGELDDPEGDSISNLMEYVLGGNPILAGQTILPTSTVDATDFVFSFNRSDDSENDTTQIVEIGGDLSTWTPVPIIPAGVLPAGVTIEVLENGTGADVVKVRIARALNPASFARLRVTK